MRRLTGVAFIAAVGCSQAPGTDGPVVRDSAGIRVTENAVPLDDVPTWSLELRQEIADERLYRIRGVTRLPDGDILVLSQGSLQLLRYGPDGSFVDAIGREGEGPGEFQWPMGVWKIPGETIMAWDSNRSYVNLYALDGRYVRGFPLELGRMFSQVLGPLGDGGLLVAQDEALFGPQEIRMTYRELLKFDLLGRLLDSLGRHPARIMGPLNLPGGRQA